MELIFLKALAVVSLVLSLTIIAEKVSPKVSGILSGLPVGSSITLLFFALEFGVNYVQKTALYNIHGLFAALAFSIGYYLSTFYKGKFGIIFSLLFSLTSYLIVALILSFIPPHIILTPLIIFTLLILSAIYFSKKENFNIEKKTKITALDLFARIVLTVGIFFIITSLPKITPSNIAGIFSSFPTILLPLMLIIHFNHSNLQARTIIKNTPFGLTSVVIYSFTVYLSYPTIGILLGTLLALTNSLILVIIQRKVFNFFKII